MVSVPAWALALTMFLRAFVIQAFRIPSESMRDTLLVGDFLFVNKFEYGPKIPFTHLRLPGLRGPRHGDVIVFQYPQDPSKDFIKRCIATGNQTLEVKNKQVYLDGRPIREPYVIHTDPATRPAGYDERDFFGPVTVNPNELFMMGDNRDNSTDSRVESAVGYVPLENLVGRAQIIFFSVAEGEQAWQFWRWPWTVRWSRLFTIVR